jgi:multiple sugar transport system permease protein
VKLRQVVLHAVLLTGAFASLFPFLWMMFASFKIYNDVLKPALLPSIWTLDNYREILGRVGFLVAFRNSAIVAIPGTISCVLTATAAGYIFAKYKFPLREFLFTAILATLMVPFTVVVIPLFLTMRDLGLINKLGGLLLTSLCSTFGIFLMRQSIETIPNDYIDAARIDGASEPWIFRQVIMPLSRQAMATVAVFTFLGLWDNYLWPSVLLRSADQYTLVERYHIWSAGSMLTVVPTMLLFTIIQKQFVRGLALAGLKG